MIYMMVIKGAGMLRKWRRYLSTDQGAKDINTISPATYTRIKALELEPTPIPFEGKPDWRTWHNATYGGSPIPIRFDARDCFSHTRLYLGRSQVELGNHERPDVECVANLCELDDNYEVKPDDRRWPRGEGLSGYTWAQLNEDAIEIEHLLYEGKRVLIHCMAGMNRSVTLTCAVLMRVEGIDAYNALRRVQRFHPRAHPEPRHWLCLRQFEIILDAEKTDSVQNS
jgi:protein-tyrosine phosphatase